jgi:hypothetical protein
LPLKGDAGNWRALPLSEDFDMSLSPSKKGLLGNVDAASSIRAAYWRINPGGIGSESMPRTLGLCSTPACTHCPHLSSYFLWAVGGGVTVTEAAGEGKSSASSSSNAAASGGGQGGGVSKRAEGVTKTPVTLDCNPFC